MRVKIEDLREHRKISCPVLFVLPGVDKNDVEKPNGKLLIDDSKKISGYGLKMVDKVLSLIRQFLKILITRLKAYSSY